MLALRTLPLASALAIVVAITPSAHADAPVDVIAPNVNLHVDGIQPIPAALAAKAAPYTEFKPRAAVSWHPQRRELVVATRAGNTTQLHLVRQPLGPLEQLTDFPDPVRAGGYAPKRPDALLFVKDTGGNEQTQLYRLEAGAREPVLLTDPQRRHAPAGFNHARTHVLLESVELDNTGRRENPQTDLTLLDPFLPATGRRITTLPGAGWGDFSFSFDDKRLALHEYKSANESVIWVMNVGTGQRKRVLPPEGSTPAAPFSSGDLAFARNGRGLFLATNRDGEFRRLAYLDLATDRLDYFGAGPPADVEEIALSPDGRTLAVITNEAGVGVLRLYDAATRKPRPEPALPVGTTAHAIWHEKSRDLAVNVNSARSPGDVYVIDVKTNTVVRWTETRAEGLDAATFQNPQLVSWKSFDGLTISGFITRPASTFTGKRPVLVAIHGGPEAQARPGFLGRRNYFVNELGIAVIEPNVRGSRGFGKTFLAQDDGMKRENAVKDIGALLDWIATQPDLDPQRIVVEGGSYGGYMSLAVATDYADRIAGSIDVVGIANFVTFLERTESYRRDLRRVEYGDEREPAMREFLKRISPVNNAERIGKPLLVVHGKNDPRVPYTEAEQIVAIAKKNRVPVWYLLADDEGHGFAKKVSADFLFYTMISFLETTLDLK
jgi:dipeptidyl aminopeptidase/acylaminoacyl peptidase